jgi:hypothetical protein
MFTKKPLPPLLVSVIKVWDKAEHNAFTDLLYAHGQFLIAFREAASHQLHNGTIRILASRDGVAFRSVASLEIEGTDLRDPKLSLMPDGRIMLLAGSTLWDKDGRFLSSQSKVAFSGPDFTFTPFQNILEQNNWLWRLTWHKGKGYGIAYTCARDEEWTIALYETDDGLHYKEITFLNIDGKPNESTVRFFPDGKMAALIRRDETYKTHALWGVSSPPFTDWEWYDLGYNFGGPNFIILDPDQVWFMGRLLYFSPYGIVSRTAMLKKVGEQFRRELVLPSFDDTSYPGLIWQDGFLWASYYSSHEGKTSIYLAKILLP